jgi:hypothetical protein
MTPTIRCEEYNQMSTVLGKKCSCSLKCGLIWSVTEVVVPLTATKGILQLLISAPNTRNTRWVELRRRNSERRVSLI